MAEPLDREQVIRLLDQLGSEQDEDVLQAARELHAQITAAELDWDELLMPDASIAADEDADEDSEEDEADELDHEDSDAAAPAGKKGRDAETLALIDKLLADSGRSDSLREELEEYKVDIAEGDFGPKDHKYVRALYARLTK